MLARAIPGTIERFGQQALLFLGGEIIHGRIILSDERINIGGNI